MTNPASGLTLIGRDRHTRSVPVDATATAAAAATARLVA